jgi:hypothetical protein
MTSKMKDDYLTNLDSMSMPWVESPFFETLLKNSKFSDDQKQLAKKYNADGYLIIDLGLSDSFIDNINNDVKAILQSNTFEGQEKYEYTDHRRLFQLWKKSDNIYDLATNKKIIETLHMLYNRKPFPFSTINFTNPTGQPLHSDTIHFNSYPKGWMVGVWVAFEDCDESNGTLRVVKGSHKWGEYDYNSLNIVHPDQREDGEKKSYRDYDQFVRRLVEAKGAKETAVKIKKGQAIIWAANLLHGGCYVDDDRVSRKSQAIHYFFNGCKKYYTPMFSEPMMGEYAEKWCNEERNILTFKEK